MIEGEWMVEELIDGEFGVCLIEEELREEMLEEMGGGFLDQLTFLIDWVEEKVGV